MQHSAPGRTAVLGRPHKHTPASPPFPTANTAARCCRLALHAAVLPAGGQRERAGRAARRRGTPRGHTHRAFAGPNPPGGALHDAVVVWLTDRGYVSPFVRVGTAVALGGRGTLLRLLLLLGRRLRAAAQGGAASQGRSSWGEAPGTATGLAPWAGSNRQEDWSLP